MEFLFSCSTRHLTRSLRSATLEDKFHIHARPCIILYFKRAIFEKQLTALHVVPTFDLFNRYVFILLTKMRTKTKTVHGCTRTDFHMCSLYCYWLTWGTGDFDREKRSVAFVTGHLFTFLVVLFLICSVTTQISICENQTTWRLEILLRMIGAALFKTKDVMKRARNISQ